MHAQTAFLKRAVTRGDAAGILTCYVVRGEWMTARDGNLQAGIPFPSLIGADFNVPAAELDAVLARVKGDVELTYAGDRVAVKGARVKATVACVVDEPPAVDLPEHGWRPLPAGFGAALRLVVPFVLDKAQNFGVRLKGDSVTVVSGRAGIDVSLPGLDAAEQALSLQSSEFITSQDDDPIDYHQDANCASFRWKDGRWLRAQVLSSPFPSNLDRVFAATADQPCPVEITEVWRAAWADAAALSEDVVELRPDRLLTARGMDTTTVEVEVATPVPEGHASCWSVASLGPVVAVATHWDPAAWPKFALFRGPNFRGAVMGASARGAS